MWPLVAMRAMDQDMALSSSQDPDVIIALAYLSGHPDWHGPSGAMVLECQHVMCSQDPVSTQPLMIAGTVDISADPRCCRTGHPGLYGPRGYFTLKV